MAVDLSGIAKWPNVPACYDWLSLDRRGAWRLQGERVTHSGLVAFLNRQYGCDQAGRWFVQNGPQRVFVTLAYTPWVFRLADDRLFAHTGQESGPLRAIYLDEDGCIVFDTGIGVGVLDDRSLASFIGQCRDIEGCAPDEQAFLGLMEGKPAAPVFWKEFEVQAIAAVDVAKRHKFDPHPQAAPAA